MILTWFCTGIIRNIACTLCRHCYSKPYRASSRELWCSIILNYAYLPIISEIYARYLISTIILLGWLGSNEILYNQVPPNIWNDFFLLMYFDPILIFNLWMLVEIERLLMAILYQFVDVFSTWTTSSLSVVELSLIHIWRCRRRG